MQPLRSLATPLSHGFPFLRIVAGFGSILGVLQMACLEWIGSKARVAYVHLMTQNR